jgi:hypothetical protein
MRGLDRIAADRRHLVASQVRCSTGFTWGRAAEAGAVIAVPGKAAAVLPSAMPGWLVERLLRFVRQRSAAILLPAEAELPGILGLRGPMAEAWLAAAWGVLAQRGAVRIRRGSARAWSGEWLVVDVVAGRVHRTAGAPMAWVGDGA